MVVEPAPVTVAIGHKPEYDSDDMKVMLDGDRLTEIAKTLPLEAVDAESIGMILFRDRWARCACKCPTGCACRPCHKPCSMSPTRI